MDKQSLVLYFMSLLFMTTALKIRDIIVPPSISLSSDDPIILDCDYDVENDTTDLVLKWFHDDQPFYQWIMKQHEPPGVMGAFRGKLDLSYKVSSNELTQYRAIKIKEPSLDLAGVYRCVVFNYDAEVSMSKRMVVISKPSQLQMYQADPENEETVSVVCSAFDVYPEPELKISTKESIEFDNVSNDSNLTEDGLFNVTQMVSLKAELLGNITDFVCELTIPETDYFIDKKLTFVPDNASSMAPLWILLLVAVMTTLLST